MNQNYFNPMSALLPAPWSRLQRELQNSLCEFQAGLKAVQGDLSFNYWVKPGEVLMQFELPGIEPDQLEVEMQGDRMHLRVNPAGEKTEKANWLRQERPEVRVNRVFEFSFPIDTEKSTANYRHGVLQLKVVSRGATAPVSLKIQT